MEGAFNSTWVNGVLKNLQESGCPRNLYNLTKNYFTQRKATMAKNKIKIERAVSKGYPQGSCLGPGLWNIFYNWLLILKFKSGTKIVAFADDLLLLIRGKSANELESIANRELKKFQRGQEKIKSVLTTKVENNVDDTTKTERKRGLGSISKQQTPPSNKNYEILG